MQEKGVQDVVHRNKIKFESNDDLVDQAFCKFNENSINNQDSHSQIQNDGTPGAEYPNENDSEYTEISKTSAIPNFMQQLYPNFIHQILPVDEIAKSINYLNSKQREVLNVVNTWA